MYKCISRAVMKDVESLNALNRASNPLCPFVSQIPMRGGKGLRDKGTFVCSIPSAPCKPDPPYSVKLTDVAVHLRWNSPPFSGDPPNEYNLQARGCAKLNQRWISVGTYSEIVASWFNVVHLVAGVKLQFRVRAKNNGGWGDWSEVRSRRARRWDGTMGWSEADTSFVLTLFGRCSLT
jgi:hypothetical protein